MRTVFVRTDYYANGLAFIDLREARRGAEIGHRAKSSVVLSRRGFAFRQEPVEVAQVKQAHGGVEFAHRPGMALADVHVARKPALPWSR